MYTKSLATTFSGFLFHPLAQIRELRIRIQNFREHSLGFVVTFRVCKGMQTIIRDGTENFGREFFRALRESHRTKLISNLPSDKVKSGILPEDLEYKNCLLDLTLTDML